LRRGVSQNVRCRKNGGDGAHTLGKRAVPRKFWVLTRDQKNLPKSLASKIPRFGDHFVDIKRDAKDGIVARETAIPAIIDAFVGKIQRSKQTHGAAKILQRKRARSLRHCFELLIRF